MKKSCKGGGPLTAVILTLFIVGLVAGSAASLINFQRKQGIRQQLKLNSMNAAEAAIDYAYTYITNDANTNGLDGSNYVPPSSGSPKPFTFPASALSFLQNKNPLPTSVGGTDPINFTDIKVTVMPRPATSTRIYKDPNDPANDEDPNRGQWVYLETISLVSSVTADQGGIKQTAYARKDINYAITNLFQHAIFFQGQLHLHRGFKVMGSVHTNGNLILNAHNGDHAVYNGFVAAGNRFYRGAIIDSGGSGANGFALVPELPNGDLTSFTAQPTGTGSGTQNTTTSFVASSFNGDLPIYTDTPSAGNFLYRFADTATDSRMANWKDVATNNFLGHLQDKSHKVPIINPIGTSNYNMHTDGTANNSAYFLIEPLLPKTHHLRTDTASQKTNYRYNLSANASIVLRVEYIARRSDGVMIPVDPNLDNTYMPDSSYTLANALPQSQNPANYIVRAYKKPSTMARPADPTERVAIPFPTDVIGRADYKRVENATVNGGSYAYAAGVAPQSIDVLGTENNITTASTATSWSPARATTAAAPSLQVQEEAWHRYHIECYYPVATAALAAGYRTTPVPYSYNAVTHVTTQRVPVLPGVGTPYDPWGGPPRVNTATYNVPTLIPATAAQEGSFPLYGLHDSRLGRGVNLLTIDISRLKQIMEEPLDTVQAKYGLEAYKFRLAFNNGSPEWNGIVYVEFPTSTRVVGWNANESAAAINRAPSTSVYSDNATMPGDNTHHGDLSAVTNGSISYLDTFLFDYAPNNPEPDPAYAPNGYEKRYPLRTSNATTIGRQDQTVPYAQAFRRYPATVSSQTICNPANAILALQVINAQQLPKINTTRFDATSSNTLTSGFTLATNAPLYLIGSWNSDGDYTTGTNVASTDPTKYATTDTGTSASTNNSEIPSAIFCDMFTTLSPGWATQTAYLNEPSTVASLTRRQNSFPGWGSDSNTYRTVEWKNTKERIEVSACIATGDFPIFEFFPHALEDFYKTNGTPCTPLVVKGCMVSMFASEVQHIKQAYSRDVNKDIQMYWAAHGANNFPSPRLHQFIMDGNFPPGTPQAYVPSQSNFQVLFKGDPLLSAAGL